MNLSDFNNDALWMITPHAMDMMRESLPAAMAAMPERFQAAGVKIAEDTYTPALTVKNGVAVIPISGSISKRMGWFSYYYGGASIDRIRKDLFAAAEDRRIKGIVPYYDTPGGTVTGVHELAEDFRKVSQIKPVVAYSDGAMMSAGIYLSSAAGEVVISPNAEIGSIGVLTVHYDFSEMDKMDGIKRTYLYAGKFKAVGNNSEPLSEEAKKIIEGHLKDVYDVFIGAVAKFKKVSEEQVRSEMAEGRTFIGQKAVDVGLADRLGSLEDAIKMASGAGSNIFVNSFNAKTAKEKKMEDITTVEQLQAAFPDLCKQMTAAAAAAVDTATPVKEAVAAETARIMGLSGVHFGKEATDKLAPIVTGGTTVAQYTAMKEALGVDKSAESEFDESKRLEGESDADFKARMLAAIESSAPADPGSGGGTPGDEKEFMALVDEYHAANPKQPRAKALAHMVRLHPAAHQAWLKKQQKKPAAVK